MRRFARGSGFSFFGSFPLCELTDSLANATLNLVGKDRSEGQVFRSLVAFPYCEITNPIVVFLLGLQLASGAMEELKCPQTDRLLKLMCSTLPSRKLCVTFVSVTSFLLLNLC